MISTLVADGPVLDAGCGTGLVGVELYGRGLEPIVGGDFSAASSRPHDREGCTADVVELDLNEPLDFADGEFRAVVSVGVFSYLSRFRGDDPRAAPSRPSRRARRVHAAHRPVGGAGVRAVAPQPRRRGVCDVSVSSPQPYLPQHPEFGGEIGIRYATLTRC